MQIMPLLTVRLSDSDQKRVSDLGSDGVAIADLVRAAIRAEHDRRCRVRTPEEIDDLMARIEAEHPIPPDSPRVPVDATDRHAVRKYIVSQLKRKR
jgi:hypothetical protein